MHSVLASIGAHAAVAAILVIPVTLLVFRRSPEAALCVVIAALIASNSSLLWLKHPFLTARWAALFTLGVVLLPELYRAGREDLRRLALLAIVPAICLLSVAWSVEPRLTFERAVTFTVVVWISAAYALRWGREPARLGNFVDAAAVLAVAVLALSLLAAPLTARSSLVHQFRGVFENPNGLGLFLGLTVPFVAGALLRRWTSLWPLLAYLIMCTIVVTDARARGGLVVLTIGAVGFALTRRQWRQACVVGLTIVAVVGGVLAQGQSLSSPAAVHTAPSGPSTGTKPSSLSNRPTPVPREPLVSRLTGARNEAWRATFRLVKRKPVLGYGFGTGDRVFGLNPAVAHFRYYEGADPASAYLRALLELGVLSVVIFVPLLAAAVLGARLLVSGGSIDGSCCALVLVGGLAAGFLESIFTTAGAPWAPLLWVSAAGCYACRRVDRAGRA